MQLQYLGTAAAEAIPAVFCRCDVCRKARARGGRNLRARSHAMVNGRLMIDFPADAYLTTLKNGIDLADIHSCLITHIHGDHFYLGEFDYLREGFARLPADYEGFAMYGSEDVAPHVERLAEATGGRFRYVRVAPFVPFTAEGMTVTALPANHGSAHPYIYLISDGERTLLYGNDTGLFLAETLDYLGKTGVRLDLVSLDCTGGAYEDLGYAHHMCLGRNEICRAQLRELGCADEKTVFVLQHFSHNGDRACYDDFAPVAKARGFETAYDGMLLRM